MAKIHLSELIKNAPIPKGPQYGLSSSWLTRLAELREMVEVSSYIEGFLRTELEIAVGETRNECHRTESIRFQKYLNDQLGHVFAVIDGMNEPVTKESITNALKKALT